MKVGLFLREGSGGKLYRRLVGGDGNVIFEDVALPYEIIISFLDSQMQKYISGFRDLENHLLFSENLDVSYLNWQDLMAQSHALIETLSNVFPEAYFFSSVMMKKAVASEDDGSASVLLQKGTLVVQAVATLYHTRVQLENIMEVCFATTSEFNQHQRFNKINATYPELANHHFAVRWIDDGRGEWVQEYEIDSLLEYFWFCVLAVLRSNKRICRCQHCWRYFVPKTQKRTDYCDRSGREGKSCKELGANLKRQAAPKEDPYLQAFQRLQKRLYERSYRSYANPHENNLDYSMWIEQASKARGEYLDGRIDGESFLACVNPGEELHLTEVSVSESAMPPLFASWQTLVEGDLNFDPKQQFEDMQVLDLASESPLWEVMTSKALEKESKDGVVSLQEKFGKK